MVLGYILILPRKHACCMTKFNMEIMKEYNFFGHDTPNSYSLCANYVIHAHTHIVNHNYKNEQEIIN